MADFSKFNPGNSPIIEIQPQGIPGNIVGTGFPALPTKAVPMGNLNPAMAFSGKPDFLRGSKDAIPETPYTHKKIDNNPSASAEEIRIDIHPNVLDQYDVYTYHFKLFLTSTEDAAEGKVLEPESQSIIVENGVTDVSIDKVEMQGIAVPSLQAGTGTQTLVKFEILEPGGAGLLDKMYYESVSLGIGNWLVTPMYLQMEFRGRDEETSEALISGDPGALTGLRWVWPVKITNMKASVSTGGTKYEVDAIFYDELAQANAYFVVQHNTVLSGLETFGKAMRQLQEKLNLDSYIQTLDSYSIPDTYEIVVDSDLENIPIVRPNGNQSTSRAGDYINLAEKTGTYNAGTSIDKIVDSLLLSSDVFGSKTQSSSTSTSTPDTANQASPMRNLWRIITETRPIKFDHLRQNNAVAITVYIVKYDLGLIEATASQTAQTSSTLEAARKRLITYNNTGILRKKYNYIFTGQNDQILNFDLNMNFSFAAVIARFGGLYSDTANSDTGIAHHSKLEDLRTATEYAQREIRWINSPENKSDPKETVEAAKVSLGNLKNLSEADRTRILSRIDPKYSKPINRLELHSQIAKAGGFQSAGDLTGGVITPKSLVKPPLTNSETKFVTDVNINSEEAREARKQVDSIRQGKLRPVPFIEGPHEINGAYGIDPHSDAGRARTSSLFSTALYSSLDASLMHIKFTIKGDPFWLFPRNEPIDKLLPFKSKMPPAQAIALIKQGHNNEHKDTVNPYGTDNFIVIRFRTPKIANDDTGITEEYSEVETYSGIYKVISIASRFEMGKFTQEITAILDNLINLKDFPEFIKQLENTNKPDLPTAESSSSLVKIPGTAIITDKIKSGVSDIKGKMDTARDLAGNAVTKVTSIGTNLTSNIPSDVGFRASEILQRNLG